MGTNISTTDASDTICGLKQNFWLRNPKSRQDVRAWHPFHGLKLGRERVYDKLFLPQRKYVYISGALLKNSDGVPELQI